MCFGGLVGEDASHAVFPSVVVRLKYGPHCETASLWPRSSSTKSVACSRLVMLVFVQPTLCFPTFVGRVAMPGIMVGPVEVAALVVNNGSCRYLLV